MAGDLLLKLSQTPARALLRRLGLPTPVVLERGEGVFPKHVLHNESVVLLGSPATDAALPALLTQDLGAGVSTGPDLLAPSERHGAKGNGRPLRLLLDCTSVSTPSDVTRLIMGTFRPALAKVTPNSRIVFLVASNQAAGPLDAALAGGLYSLARSLAKELGMGGTTVNVVRVVRSQASAPLPLAHAAWPIGFLLSPDSCFVSGQQLSVCAPQWRRPADQQDRHQRVALVTGASRGIGAAIAVRLAAEGVKVVGVDMPSAKQELEHVMRGVGGTAVCQDITHSQAPGRLREVLLEVGGGVDVVVHNAGVTRDKTLRNMRAEQFEEVVRVNLEAILAINQALGLTPHHDEQGAAAAGGGRGMVVRPGGRVVLLSSINGMAGALGQTNYSFTKGALLQYAEQLAGLMGPRWGITCNCVAPGFIETAMVAHMPALLQLLGRRANALSQAGQPRDVAAAVAFLSSEHCQAVTGQALRVCGLNTVGR